MVVGGTIIGKGKLVHLTVAGITYIAVKSAYVDEKQEGVVKVVVVVVVVFFYLYLSTQYKKKTKIAIWRVQEKKEKDRRIRGKIEKNNKEKRKEGGI